MKLKSLLEQHQKTNSQGLPGSLGDGYLVTHNPVYKNIREEALKLGFKFSSDPNSAYESFPLLQLEEILALKTLPYTHNTAAFEKLTSKQTEALDWEDLDGNLKKNYVFHEGAHAIARAISQKLLPEFKLQSSLTSQREFVFKMLLEESFVNTTELMASLEVHDKVHRCFFELNSYMNNFYNQTHFKNALKEFGKTPIIRFMLVSYLYANFLKEEINDKELKTMAEWAFDGESSDTKALKTLRFLSKTAFTLSERFRYQTTSFHLRLAGITTPAPELLNFDFMPLLLTGPYTKYVQALMGTFK
jgi:hypothetical protein